MKKLYIIIAVALAVLTGGAFYFKLMVDAPESKDLAELKKAVQAAPDDIELRQRLGLLYMYNNDFKNSENEFLKILDIDPYNLRALKSVGMVYYSKGEPHKALAYWRRLLDIEPGNQFIWGLVNKLSAGEKKAGPTHAQGDIVTPLWEKEYRLAQEAYQKKDFNAAIGHFASSAALKPDDFRTYFNMASVYYEMGELEKAKEFWEKALKRKKDDQLTMRLLTLVEEGLKRKENIEGLKQRIKKDPGNWTLHKELGDHYLRSKKTLKQAEKEYMASVRLNTRYFAGYEGLVNLYKGIRDYDSALIYAKRLKGFMPKDADYGKMVDSIAEYRGFAERDKERLKKKGALRNDEMLPISGGNGVLFYMDKYEATVSRYGKFLDESGRTPPANWEDLSADGMGNYPVTDVSWYDAHLFCKHEGKRLPTEDEWIKAGWTARGVLIKPAKYPWGDEFHIKNANTKESGFGKTAPAGSYEQYNGLYDMVGNVLEWTATEEEGKKIKKGGAFSLHPEDIAYSSRSASPAGDADAFTGFRCAKDK